jgi:ribonuclease G
MRRELIVSAGPGEWRAVLVEDGVAVEARVERGEGREAGSVHLGRVLRLLPALGAALVDIGGDRPAFLPQSEIFPRGRRLDEGEQVMVQMRREAQGGKAPRLTTAVALRGRFVELTIGRSGVLGADALSPEEEAHLLATIAVAPNPPATRAPPSPRMRGEGGGERPLREPAIGLRIIEPTPKEALASEAKILRRRWLEITEHAARLDPPARLHPAATFAAALAGTLLGAERILVDEPAAIPEIRAAFPDANVVHAPESQWPVDLDALFDEALSPTIALAGGGLVHIEAARAATLIDVDSGTPETGSPERTALATNIAAAAVIARQLRLRHLGGAIVVDFIGLDDRAARERVRAALARVFAADPARPEILGWTRLGHLEIVRPRRLRPLAEALLEAAPGGLATKTAVTVAHEALRQLRREERAQPGHRWRLTAAPDVAAALAGAAACALRAFEQRSGREIAIAADPDLARGQFQISLL